MTRKNGTTTTPRKWSALGDALQARRGDRTLRDLALELRALDLNIDHSQLHYIEQGRMPRADVFVQLMHWLGIIDRRTTAKLLQYAKTESD